MHHRLDDNRCHETEAFWVAYEEGDLIVDIVDRSRYAKLWQVMTQSKVLYMDFVGRLDAKNPWFIPALRI